MDDNRGHDDDDDDTQHNIWVCRICIISVLVRTVASWIIPKQSCNVGYGSWDADIGTCSTYAFEYFQKLCILENERDLLEYEKKDLEKKLAYQKTDSELLSGQLRVCSNCYCYYY